MSASITSKIEKLQEDLPTENKIMDKIAIKTEKAKILKVQLANTNQELDALKSKMVVLKRCVTDFKLFWQTFIETHNSLLTVSVRQHLADKFEPVFSMLNRIKGVSESGFLLR